MNRLSTALVAGLAGVWVWSVLNDDEGVAAPLTKALRKNDVTQKWMECPWCSGAWFAAAGTAVLHDGDFDEGVVVWLGASAVTGIVGSYIGEG